MRMCDCVRVIVYVVVCVVVRVILCACVCMCVRLCVRVCLLVLPCRSCWKSPNSASVAPGFADSILRSLLKDSCLADIEYP